jgi:hypothetical protein
MLNRYRQNLSIGRIQYVARLLFVNGFILVFCSFLTTPAGKLLLLLLLLLLLSKSIFINIQQLFGVEFRRFLLWPMLFNDGAQVYKYNTSIIDRKKERYCCWLIGFVLHIVT